MSYTDDIRINPIIISDHAPIPLNLNGKQSEMNPRWHFNTAIKCFIRRKWASFMEINDSPDITRTIRQETGKAVLRGKILIHDLREKWENNLKKTISKTFMPTAQLKDA